MNSSRGRSIDNLAASEWLRVVASIEANGRLRVRVGDYIDQHGLTGRKSSIQRRPDIFTAFDTTTFHATGQGDCGMVHRGEINRIGMVAKHHILGVLLIA